MLFSWKYSNILSNQKSYNNLTFLNNLKHSDISGDQKHSNMLVDPKHSNTVTFKVTTIFKYSNILNNQKKVITS